MLSHTRLHACMALRVSSKDNALLACRTPPCRLASSLQRALRAPCVCQGGHNPLHAPRWPARLDVARGDAALELLLHLWLLQQGQLRHALLIYVEIVLSKHGQVCSSVGK